MTNWTGNSGEIPDRTDAGKADPGGQFFLIQELAIARKRGRCFGPKDDPTLAALQLASTVIVEIDVPGVQDLEEALARTGPDEAKTLDADLTFP